MPSLACHTHTYSLNWWAFPFSYVRMYVCLSDASEGASHYNCFSATRFTSDHCILPSCSLHATVAHIYRWVMTAGLTGVISIVRVLAEWSVVVLSANARNSSEGSSVQAMRTALIGSCRWNIRGQLGIPAAQPWHNENTMGIRLTGTVEYSVLPCQTNTYYTGHSA